MVTGTPPFEGESSQEIVGKHLSEPAPVATAKNARIPMWLSDIIVRCLAKRPAERFQSAAMLLDALNAGRQSGAQEPVSAERVVRKLEEATEVMPSRIRPGGAAVETAEGVSTSTKATTPGGPPAEPPRRPKLPLLLGLVMIAAAAGWFIMGKAPVMVVHNRLVEPIKVVLGAETFDVPAGGEAEHTVKGKGPLVAQWYLVRPLGTGGQPLGMELQGRLLAEKPEGVLSFDVDASSGDRPAFAPLVSNATSGPLAITVNAGTVNAQACDCRVTPGATRARIGYYPLFVNSSLQAAASGGGVATFRDLGAQVDRRTGTVGLRFEAKDFPH
jgi:hypothetical protein